MEEELKKIFSDVVKDVLERMAGIAAEIEMDLDKLRERLTVAGNKFDGHVTSGSMQAQMDEVTDFLTEMGQKMQLWAHKEAGKPN